MVEKLSISYRIDRDNFGTYIMPSRRLNFRDDRPHFGHGIPLGIRVHTNPDIRLGVFDDNTNDELVFIKADCL